MQPKPGFGRGGKYGDPVLVPFALPHGDLAVAEVDVLDPQGQAFEEAETGAVHQRGGDEVLSRQMAENLRNLIPGEDDRQQLRTFRANHAVEPVERDAEDVPVQEQESAERLVLRGGGDAQAPLSMPS